MPCLPHGDAAHLIDVGDDVDTEDEWDSKTQNYGLFSRSNTCNGIILCKDLCCAQHSHKGGHLAFDEGMWTFDPDGRVFVSKAVRLVFHRSNRNKLKKVMTDKKEFSRLTRKATALISLHGKRVKMKETVPPGVFEYRWRYFKRKRRKRHDAVQKDGFCGGCGRTYKNPHVCKQKVVLKTPESQWESDSEEEDESEEEAEEEQESEEEQSEAEEERSKEQKNVRRSARIQHQK